MVVKEVSEECGTDPGAGVVTDAKDVIREEDEGKQQYLFLFYFFSHDATTTLLEIPEMFLKRPAYSQRLKINVMLYSVCVK